MNCVNRSEIGICLACRCRLNIPEQAIAEANKLFAAPLVLYIFRWGQKTGTASFWAQVAVDGTAEVWLPCGTWAITIANKWNNAGPTNKYGFIVSSGLYPSIALSIDVQIFSRFGRWFRRVTWGREPIIDVAKDFLVTVARRVTRSAGKYR